MGMRKKDGEMGGMENDVPLKMIVQWRREWGRGRRRGGQGREDEKGDGVGGFPPALVVVFSQE